MKFWWKLNVMALLYITALTGCVQEVSTGSAFVGVSTSGLSAEDVARVNVTVSGPHISPVITYELVQTHGRWEGIITNIPVGSDRVFDATAFDSLGEEIYGGSVEDVSISRDDRIALVILLQQSTPDEEVSNHNPLIDWLTAAPVNVAPGDSVELEVAAHDLDPEDVLTYSWEATAGLFDASTSATPVWTAPADVGVVTITVTVSDGRGGTDSISIEIDVQEHHADGEAQIEVDFNNWPTIEELTATPGRVEAGETTSLSVVATDSDGDSLSFLWGDEGGDCSGVFSATDEARPTWTAPAAAPASGMCTLSVEVTDGRGGSHSGSVTVNIGPAGAVNRAPEIVSGFQSRDVVEPSGIAVFRVVASDPDGDDLSFVWNATEGTLHAPIDGADSSERSWLAPVSCSDLRHEITVTVTDTTGLSVERVFFVSTPCDEPEVLFEDDFDSGVWDSEWESLFASQFVIDGWLHTRDTDGWPRNSGAVVHSGNTDWTDYTLHITADFVAGTGWEDFSILIRNDGCLHASGVPNTGNCYQVWFRGAHGWSDGGNMIDLIRHNATDYEYFPRVHRVISTDPMDIVVTVIGDHIRVWVDGTLIFDVVDPTPITYGGIGIEAIWEAEARFDNVLVIDET